MTAAQSLIANNPYRILGVYVASSPAKEVSNKNKISAYSKVGQCVVFRLRGDDSLPDLQRSEDPAAEAAQSLSLPADRIRHGLFWFTESEEAWGVCLNEAVEALIGGDVPRALECYDRLISRDDLRSGFSLSVTHGLLNVGAEELVGTFSSAIAPSLSVEDFGESDFSISSLLGEALLQKSGLSFESLDAISNLKIDAYDSADELIRMLNELRLRLSVMRKILGKENLQYCEFVESLARLTYETAKKIAQALGGWAWNTMANDHSRGWVREVRISTRDAWSFNVAMTKIRQFSDAIYAFIESLDMPDFSKYRILFYKNEFEAEVSYQLDGDADSAKITRRKRLFRRIKTACWIAFLIFLFYIV